MKMEAKITFHGIGVVESNRLNRIVADIIVIGSQSPLAFVVKVHFDCHFKRRSNGCISTPTDELFAQRISSVHFNGILTTSSAKTKKITLCCQWQFRCVGTKPYVRVVVGRGAEVLPDPETPLDVAFRMLTTPRPKGGKCCGQPGLSCGRSG